MRKNYSELEAIHDDMSSVKGKRRLILSVLALFALIILSIKSVFHISSSISDQIQKSSHGRLHPSTTSPLHERIKEVSTKPNSTSCQRKCVHYNNIIYYTDAPAGLSDRKVIIHDLAELAGYLCAKLVFPPPYVMLSKEHNQDKAIHTNIDWSDFYNLTYRRNNVPAVASVISKDSSISWFLRYKREDEDWHDIPVFDTTSETSKYKDWLHVISEDGELVDDFVTIQNFSFLQELLSVEKGFVWEIHKKFYVSDLWNATYEELQLSSEVDFVTRDIYNVEMRPYLNTLFFHKRVPKQYRLGCKYTNDKYATPSHIQLLQQKLMARIQELSLRDAIIGHLHLRRGDSIDECDTSIERMQRYFQCSLNNTNLLGKNMTIVLTTDETSALYRKNVMGLIDEYNHVSILDGDTIAMKIVADAINNRIIPKYLRGNFYTFEVENILRDWGSRFIDFHLIRRRTTCNECINLYQKFRASSK